MNWLTAAQIPLVIGTLWYFTAWMTRGGGPPPSSFPTLRGRRICLLIAHPDDEAMFFGPTLLALTRPELENRVVLLCLSTGDADGLGAVRARELAASAVRLGLRSAERVVVVDDPARFPDSMRVHWEAAQIAETLRGYFGPSSSSSSDAGGGAAKTTGTLAASLDGDHGAKRTGTKKSKTKKTAISTVKTSNARDGGDGQQPPPPALIDVLITFDEGGVSGHPNHRSLYHGAVAFVRSLTAGYAGWEPPVQLYTLTTTNVVRKYSGVLDAAATIATCLWRRKERGDFPTPLLFVSGFAEYRRAQLAMTAAHQSQMRWFRWGWIGISRYMVVNDLTKQKV